MAARNYLNLFKNVKRIGNGWTALCPSHDDQQSSLSIGEGEDGRLLLHCFANCTFEAILKAAGIDQAADIGSAQGGSTLYDYRDEDGTLLFQVIRRVPRGFTQRRPDGNGGWLYKLDGVRRVPYRLSELRAAHSDEIVFIVEGEKDADRLASFGFVATTNSGGAGKWRPEYSEYLRQRHAVIIPDNDEPGHLHAMQVARSLNSIAASVKVVALSDVPPKGDISDWLDGGGTIERLRQLVDAASIWSEAVSEQEATLKIVCMSDVAAEEVRWLWHPYIPYGKLTMLEGDPGLGKSWLTCAIAAGVSCGRGLPGAGDYEPGNVLMLSAEDGLADTLRPRLDALGADVSRIFALEEPLTFDNQGLKRLEEEIKRFQPALVIIDPLFAFTGGKVDIHRANESRAISAPLAAIAERQSCALVAVRHLSKSRGGGHALNAGIGSIDFTAAARSVLLVGADPDEPSKRAVVQIKNNLAPHGSAVGYKVQDGSFFWMGESNLTASRMLSISDAEGRGARTEAIAFLQEVLRDGARPAKEVMAEARRAGISERTLTRARDSLHIKPKKEGGGFGQGSQRWLWALPNKEECQEASEES